MTTKELSYWEECISLAAEDCDLVLTQDQLNCLATSAKMGHEYYGMAFYQPPSSDRIAAIENEWKVKLQKLQSEFDNYRQCSEKAVKTALRVDRHENVSINEYGEVYAGTYRIL